MKKNVLKFGMQIVIVSFIAFGMTNCEEKKKVQETIDVNTKAVDTDGRERDGIQESGDRVGNGIDDGQERNGLEKDSGGAGNGLEDGRDGNGLKEGKEDGNG